MIEFFVRDNNDFVTVLEVTPTQKRSKRLLSQLFILLMYKRKRLFSETARKSIGPETIQPLTGLLISFILSIAFRKVAQR